ncbi:MAG: 2-hydroxyglutaryl-CoA dehydratase [Clostridia bacterium]|nr:MAG: 2-hydroxyglutaryl-CoA dehydratase [Clostridia bacterium]
MLVAGIDVGSRNAKAVVMQNGEIVSYGVCDTGPSSAESAQEAVGSALRGTEFRLQDLDYVIATGYGRVLVPFANENVSEIACHARGAHWYFPSTRTILDIGGQDSKAINCNETGQVTRFVMNDKCAGGTGRFLESIADLFQVSLEEMGRMALQSKTVIPFGTSCALLARSEAIALLKKGVLKNDILAAIHNVLASRCYNLVQRVSLEPDFIMTGGVCKNLAMLVKIQEKVGREPLVPPEPLIVGALGAALFAEERFAASSAGMRPSAAVKG